MKKIHVKLCLFFIYFAVASHFSVLGNSNEKPSTSHKSDSKPLTSVQHDKSVAKKIEIGSNGLQSPSEEEYPIKNKKESMKGHILFFHNFGTKSHVFSMKALAEGLVHHGHKVTTVFYVETNIVHENYTEIFIKDR